MSSIDVQKNARSLSIGKKLPFYTGVIIHAGQDNAGKERDYFSGDNTGYVLELDNPNGTQEIADFILASLKQRGVRYQPYEANGAILDPAAEIGDGITVNGTLSFIASSRRDFSRLMAADVSAPFNEEVNHEFQYKSKAQREFSRESLYTRSRLTIAENEISAKVSEIGGNSRSFGWVLTATGHTWYANGVEVMRVTSNGLMVKGEINAISGVIGGCEIVNGVLKVNSANIGSINADTITAGTLSVDRIEDHSITGEKIGQHEITGGDWGNIDSNTVSTYNTVNGINTNLGYAAGYGLATSYQGSSGPTYFNVGRTLTVGYAIVMNGAGFTPKWSDVLGEYYLGSGGEG